MGNKQDKIKYDKLFDPKEYNLEENVKLFIEIEYAIDIFDYKQLIHSFNKYYRLFETLNYEENPLKYWNDGAHLIAFCRMIQDEKVSKSIALFYKKKEKDIKDHLQQFI